MTTFTFELSPYVVPAPENKLVDPSQDPRRVGRSGTLDGFGDVTVEFMHWDSSGPRREPGWRTVNVEGQALPHTALMGRDFSGQPTLPDSTLRLGIKSTKLKVRNLGLTKSARAVHFSIADRDYVLKSAGAYGNVAVRREGVQVSFRQADDVVDCYRAQRKSTLGTVEGPADATDLAIALLFTEVDTYSLTAGMSTFVGSLKAVGSLLQPGGDGV